MYYSYLLSLSRLLFTLSFLVPSLLLAQQDNTHMDCYSKDTILLGLYKGELQQDCAFSDSAKTQPIKQGKLMFQSDLYKFVRNNKICLQELSIEGEYGKDKKENAWEYILKTFWTDTISVVQNNRLSRLDYVLSGRERYYKMPFKKDMRNGQWTINTRHIQQGRFGALENMAKVEYSEDKLVGAFTITFVGLDKDTAYIDGRTNAYGVLDSVLRIEYFDGFRNIREERVYEDGFLRFIVQSDRETSETLAQVEFDDIIQGLNALERGDTSFQYKKSSETFGILFTNGYRDNDARLLIQEQGNSLLEQAIEVFDDYAAIFGETSVKQKGGLTRRFEFVYPEYEDSLLQFLFPKTELLDSLLESTALRPRFVVRKESSDTLAYINAWLRHSETKVEKIRSVLQKIEAGDFAYIYRDNYYKKGLTGLNRLDSISYVYDAKERVKPYDLGLYIDTPEELLKNIETYLDSMSASLKIKENLIDETIVSYENREFVDSVDMRLSESKIFFDSVYSDAKQAKDENEEELSLSTKLYLSSSERIINPLKESYLANGLSLAETEELANKLICVMDFLSENKNRVNQIEGYPKYWNDSIFKVYTDNPFDNRPFETTILSGSQQAVDILLRYYANNLLNAKNCETLQKELAKIEKLEKRVRYLRKHYETDNVQLLDRALRRERVPNRIERILEL